MSTNRRFLKDLARGLLTAMLFCALALADPGGGPPGTNGSYKVEFRGSLIGSGNAAVGAQSVTINGKVRDELGNTGNLVAPNLDLNNGRFNGSGTGLGRTIILSGRIDPADGTLQAARLVCTYRADDGTYGRIVGFKKN